MTMTATQYEVRGIMIASIGAMNHVMNLQTSGRAAAIHPATTAAAAPHEARDARCDVLVRPLRRRTIDRTNMLGIAHRAVDRLGIDRDLGTGALLPAAAAALAHGHGDLELRP